MTVLWASLRDVCFLVRGGPEAAAAASGPWGSAALRRLLGAQKLNAVSVPYASMFVGGRQRETTAAEFLEGMAEEDNDEEVGLNLNCVVAHL